MSAPESVGQVLLDYSVRAETAAGHLRNALQICTDPDVTRLMRAALEKIERPRTALDWETR